MPDFVKSAGTPPGPLSLQALFPHARFHHCQDLSARHCAGTWSDCRRNDIFVAQVTADHDGHEDINRAIARGAAGLVVERLLPIDFPQCVVEDGRSAFGSLTHALAGNPAERLESILVAGSDGKSSVANLIRSVLAAGGKKAGFESQPHLDGTSTSTWIPGQPLWSPPRLTSWLDRQMGGGMDAAIVEAHEADLIQRTLAGARFGILSLTNLRSRLPSRHRTILRAVDHLVPDRPMIVNVDDPVTGGLLETLDGQVLTIGIREDADVHAKILESTLYGQTFAITAGYETIVVESSIPGAAHVYNSLQAAATGILAGLNMTAIREGLQNCRPMPGRHEMIRCGQPFGVMIDVADSPWRLGAALNLLRHHSRGRILCVLSVPESASAEQAAEFGRAAEKGSDLPIITRPKVGLETDYERFHQVLDGFRRKSRARSIPDRIAAIEWTLAQAGAEDTVLIAGSGNQSICALAGDRWQLRDADVCQAWLWTNQAPADEPEIANGETGGAARILRLDDFRR